MSGAEQSLLDLVVGEGRGPVEAVVALPSDGPLAQQLRANGVLVRTVPMSRRLLETSRETLRRSPIAAIARLGAFLAAGWRTLRLIRDVRPDVVHTNTLKTHLIAVLPCLLARVPLVWHVRDILPPGWLRRAVVAAARFPAVVIVPSRAVAESFRGQRRVYRKLRLVPNGIRIDDFINARTDRSLRQMMGVNASDPVIGLVGRIAPWKGQDVFLRSAAMLAHRYPKAHFSIIGAVLFPENDSEYEEHLHRMVVELGIEERVSFLGWQPAPEAMAALDIFVHASAEPEPFGRAIVEAMASGKPVVAAGGGAVPELVPPAAGFIVPPGRPELLADALDRLLDDRKLRERMGKAGASIAASFFPVERTVASVGQLHRALAARAARRRKAAARRSPARRVKQQPRRTAPEQRPISWPRPGERSREDVRSANGNGAHRPIASHPVRGAPAGRNGSRPRTEQTFDVDGDDLAFAIDDRIDGPEFGPDHGSPGAARARRTDDIDDAPLRVRAQSSGSRPVPVSGTTAVMDVPRAAAKRTVALRRPAQVRPQAAATVALPAPSRAFPATPVRPDRGVLESKPVYDALKRAMDLTLSLAVLIIGLPVWTLIAIAIKLESPGPVLHRGTVVGRRCRPFTYYKFRSMRIDRDDKAHRRFIERYVRENGGHEAEGEVIYKLLGDDRITKVGGFIRALSLDEIPQLFNVVRGEMSIVGPRPPLDYEYEHYDERAKVRLRILPGITGMQQVWHRHTASFEEKLALDFKYMAARSVWLDLKLIVHSARAVFRGH
jgi:lipopolysaccharide/colanic/teichoic acid biosynthesis glycosyltransferase/glycosyltransferase involved in cell wall biosynthesis